MEFEKYPVKLQQFLEQITMLKNRCSLIIISCVVLSNYSIPLLFPSYLLFLDIGKYLQSKPHSCYVF